MRCDRLIHTHEILANSGPVQDIHHPGETSEWRQHYPPPAYKVTSRPHCQFCSDFTPCYTCKRGSEREICSMLCSTARCHSPHSLNIQYSDATCPEVSSLTLRCLQFRKFTQWSQWIYNPNNLLAWQEVSVKNVVLIRFLRWNHKILHLLPCLSGTSSSQTNPNRAWLMNFNSILTSPNQIKFSGMSSIQFCSQK